MLRIFILITLLVCSFNGQTETIHSLYQVDVIIFIPQPSFTDQAEAVLSPLIPPNTRGAILLQDQVNETKTPYHLLPPSMSQLGHEYWALDQNSQYQVLGHYTWLQPNDNQRAIALPAINRSGWNVEGTLRIRRNNYYLLDAKLQFSNASNHQPPFLFSQKQRLKSNVIYYLDHPQAGMLIKVHPVA